MTLFLTTVLCVEEKYLVGGTTSNKKYLEVFRYMVDKTMYYFTRNSLCSFIGSSQFKPLIIAN